MIPRYYPSIGGGQKHVQVLSEELVRAGHEVTVLTTDAVDGQVIWNPAKERIHEPETVINGVRVLRFSMRHLLNSKYTFPALHRLLLICSKSRVVPISVLNSLGRFIPWVPDMQRWLDTNQDQFDIVGAFSLPYDSFMLSGQQFARRRGIPFTAYALAHLGVVKGMNQVDPHGHFYTMRHQNTYILKSDMLIANSEDEKAFYVSKGMPEEKVVVGGPGIYREESAESDGARFLQKHNITNPIILCIATMARVKGVMDNIEAVYHLNATDRAATLVLIGNVTEEFETYWAQLPPEKRDHVHVLGDVDDAEKFDALAAAEVFSMPSKTDSFGIVYLEAWLHRLPVIGADSWGVRRVIEHGTDGFLVEFGNPADLSERMRYLLENREAARKMGQRGFEKTLNNHLWEHKVEIVQRSYKRLVQANKLAPLPTIRRNIAPA